MKFGRKPAVHNRRTMRLAIAFHRALASLGTAPTVSDDYISAVMKQSPQGWICWLNNSLGDCVAEDSGHELMLHSANASTIVIPSTQDILALYEAVGGYNPSDPSTDQGCDETSMEQYMMQAGLCGQKSVATGPVDPSNMDHLRWAVQIFGACRLGIAVTDQMMNDFNAGNAWETFSGDVEGGHDVPIVKYDAAFAYVVTWGKLQPVAWSLVANSNFLQEAHLSVWPDFTNAGGTTPAGFKLADMIADAQAVEQTS